jgi:hypothetical protein
VEQPEPRRFDRGITRDLAQWEKAWEREQRKIKRSERDAVASLASRKFADVGGMQLPLSKLADEESGMDGTSGEVFDTQTAESVPQVGDLVVFKFVSTLICSACALTLLGIGSLGTTLR